MIEELIFESRTNWSLGRLPELPFIVKARYVSARAELVLYVSLTLHLTDHVILQSKNQRGRRRCDASSMKLSCVFSEISNEHYAWILIFCGLRAVGVRN